MFRLTKFQWLATVCLLLLGYTSTSAADAAYGVKVKYRESGILTFPDFTLTPLGSHRETPPQYPHGWLVHEFLVKKGDSKTVVKWSAGTGLIGPATFTIAGGNYRLELARTKQLGWLKPDELVVSRAP